MVYEDAFSVNSGVYSAISKSSLGQSIDTEGEGGSTVDQQTEAVDVSTTLSVTLSNTIVTETETDTRQSTSRSDSQYSDYSQSQYSSDYSSRSGSGSDYSSGSDYTDRSSDYSDYSEEYLPSGRSTPRTHAYDDYDKQSTGRSGYSDESGYSDHSDYTSSSYASGYSRSGGGGGRGGGWQSSDGLKGILKTNSNSYSSYSMQESHMSVESIDKGSVHSMRSTLLTILRAKNGNAGHAQAEELAAKLAAVKFPVDGPKTPLLWGSISYIFRENVPLTPAKVVCDMPIRLATLLVPAMISNVVASFVALECGGGHNFNVNDYDQGHENNKNDSMHIQPYKALNELKAMELDLLPTSAIIKAYATIVVRTSITEGACNAIRAGVMERVVQELMGEEFQQKKDEKKLGKIDLHGGQFFGTFNEEDSEQMKKHKHVEPLVPYDYYDPADPMMADIEGYPSVPMKCRWNILDLIGLDLSGIDKRVFPRRPYLTACKPYGNWAAETGQVWNNIDNLPESRMTINWYDLPGRWKWQPFVLRIGQVVMFDLHDGGSGMVVAKCHLPYESLMVKEPINDIVTLYVDFQIANEYGGGSLGAVLRVQLDLSVNIWVRPKKDVEYWNEQRVHHWQTYPLTPISTGALRQAYPQIAEDYDQQKLIHPAFFGFRVRWRGK